MNDDQLPPRTREHRPATAVLPGAEVTRRTTLLAELQAAFTDLRVQAVLARRRRIVLRSTGNDPEPSSPMQPSGPVEPQLHIFGPDGTDVATTDGTSYPFASGPAHPASDPRAAAASILSSHDRSAASR